MNRKKAFLAVQSALCILTAALLAAAAVGLYREGLAAKAENPLAWSFSRGKVAERVGPILPVLLLCLGTAAAGLILGIRDEKGLKPAKGGRIKAPAPWKGERVLRAALLAAAVLLMIAGAFNGSARDVFGKAVKICTECVGLG